MPSPVRVRYQTFEFGEADIHLRTLRDRQQFSDPDQAAERLGVAPAFWPLFGVVWESGVVLARMMHARDVNGLRVLEVGCGIGLASLVLHQRDSDISATDQHPEAGAFLLENVALNRMRPLPFVRAGWDEHDDALGRFDLVLGSDLLYDQPNVALLSAFIERHANPACEVIIVDPGRGLVGEFSRRMLALGYDHDTLKVPYPGIPDSFRGSALRYARGVRAVEAAPV